MGPQPGDVDELEWQRALEASRSTEPLTVDQRDRQEGVPVGLKNVGNSCYSNALVQSVFFLPNMTKKILNARVDTRSLLPNQPGADRKESNSLEQQRELASRKMIAQL